MLAFLSGLLAGCLHVLSGPDHVAAVAPLAVRDGRAGGAVGASWGMGHGGGVLLWLLVSTLVGKAFRVELVSEAAEILVGLSLVGIGAFTLWQRKRHRDAPHQHDHRTAFGMGVLHGTAGAGHFLFVLPTLGLPPERVAAYASGYLISAVAVMAAAGTLFAWLGTRAPQAAHLRTGFALCTIVVGLAWLGSSTLAVL